jgi:hypothetical protein
VKESSLSINEFNKPLRYEDDYAKAILIVRLIILNPGENIYHPLMGIGITKRRYTLMDGTQELEEEISKQIQTYLPELLNTNVEVVYKDHALYFGITVNKKTYLFKKEDSSDTLTLMELKN